MSKRPFLIFCFCLFWSSTNLFAQQDKTPFKTNSISIFKNNTAFFIKSGKVNTNDGTYKMTSHFPAALYGTLWIHSPEKSLKNISSYEEEEMVTEKVDAETIEAMIRANLDKKVKLFLEKNIVYEGTIINVEKEKVDPKVPFIGTTFSRILTIKTDREWIALPIDRVKKVAFMEQPNLTRELTTNKKQRVLQVDFNNKKKQQALNMMYLTAGVNWSPIYLLELLSEKKARLTLRGELSNDAEDIENTDVNFVVGVPNFRFANRLTPLVDFLKNIPTRPTNDWSATSNVLRSQTISYGVQADQVSTSAPIGGDVEGTSSEDLFFYHLKNVSLKKGGRGQYELFKKDIDIAHIYEANLSQNSENRGFYQKEFLFTPDTDNKVFHSVKVNNDSAYPWTTAAVMVTNEEGTTKPISQDMLTYTSIKGNSFVKLTEAPDVRIKHAEKEIDRQLKVKKKPSHSGYHLDLITVEGQLKIKNYKSKKIDLNVRRTIIGQLENSSVEWLKAEVINRGGNSNKTNNVCWETTIKPGEELEIKYSYKVYVQH